MGEETTDTFIFSSPVLNIVSASSILNYSYTSGQTVLRLMANLLGSCRKKKGGKGITKDWEWLFRFIYSAMR